MYRNEINIYAASEKLTDILRTVEPLDGYKHTFHILRPGDTPEVNSSSANIFILSKIPSRIHDGAKYILCSQNPASLTKSQLSLLYEIWPQPLTSELVKFFFGRLLVKLRYELENTAEHQEHQKRILEMARQDYLTGLATRWYLQDFIETNQHEKFITCIYFDLDHFKEVNDTFGHQAGDRALAATAEMMQSEFADGFAARLGGDEFMIVLLGQRAIGEVQDKVNEFMKHLLRYYDGVPAMRKLSVSAGISQAVPEQPKSIDQLIHESDRALYSAKNEGRARCIVYDASMEGV